MSEGDRPEGSRGDEFTELVEGRFVVGERARLRSRNVSGHTRIVVGEPGVVRIQARKRVRGISAEKARRLLQNVEVRMEQDGDLIEVRPHLYEQDRGWLDLFRGGRVTVDLMLTVPREIAIEAHTVNGPVHTAGTRGDLEVQTVSGDVRVDGTQGALTLRSVSGDLSATECCGRVEANTVSGDLTLERCRVQAADIVSVSGDLTVGAALEAGAEHRFKSISGDVALGLAASPYEVAFRTMSGDLRLEAEGQVTREGRRDRTVVLGAGGERTRVTVKTVSGDLRIHRASGPLPTGPAVVPAAPPPPAAPDPTRRLLERVASGELDIESAAQALDDARGRR